MKHALSMLTLLLLALSTVGCGTDQIARTGGSVTLVDDDGPPEAFTIKRATLDHALTQGAGWFIRQVSVRPVVTGDERFFGFQLVAIFPDAQLTTPLPLRAGDIIQQVNGSSIERPEQFMEVWSSLKTASHLSIRFVRNGQPLQVTWVIEDEGHRPAVSALGL